MLLCLRGLWTETIRNLYYADVSINHTKLVGKLDLEMLYKFGDQKDAVVPIYFVMPHYLFSGC